MKPNRCQCIYPELRGKRVDFMTTRGGDRVQAHDFRIKCRGCDRLWGWMKNVNFKLSGIRNEATYTVDN